MTLNLSHIRRYSLLALFLMMLCLIIDFTASISHNKCYARRRRSKYQKRQDERDRIKHNDLVREYMQHFRSKNFDKALNIALKYQTYFPKTGVGYKMEFIIQFPYNKMEAEKCLSKMRRRSQIERGSKYPDLCRYYFNNQAKEGLELIKNYFSYAKPSLRNYNGGYNSKDYIYYGQFTELFESRSILFMKGCFLKQTGAYKSALNVFEQNLYNEKLVKCVCIPEGFLEMCDIYLEQNNIKKARNMIDEYRYFRKDDSYSNAFLIKVARAEKNYQEVLKLLQRRIAEKPHLFRPRFEMARCYQEMGKFKTAKEYYEDLMERFPDQPEVYAQLVDIEISLRHFEKAESIISDYIKKYPDQSEAYQKRFSVYYYSEQWDKALADCQWLCDHSTQKEPWQKYSFYIHMARLDFAAAEKTFAPVILKHPQDPMMNMQWGYAQFGAKMYDETIQTMRKGLRDPSLRTEALLCILLCKQYLGKDVAVENIRASYKDLKSRKNALNPLQRRIFDYLCEVKTADQITLLTKKKEEQAFLYFFLGAERLGKGKRNEAESYFSKAVATGLSQSIYVRIADARLKQSNQNDINNLKVSE